MAKKKMDFETAMARMEEIISQLENEEVSLDQSIALYREGMDLAAVCKTKLSNAEKQVMELHQNADGSFTEKPFLDREAENEL